MGLKDEKIISGHAFVKKMHEFVRNKIKVLQIKYHITPGLAIVRVGEDEASKVYVQNKLRVAKELGINAFEYHFESAITQKILDAKIDNLNNNNMIHGIIVQLPLPDHINKHEVINAIDPLKDVDGFNTINVGKLHTGQDCLEPCTPVAIVMILKELYGDLSSKKVTIIGRSDIVGKPVAAMLLKENCTIKMLHSYTTNINKEAVDADILISAVGLPGLVKADWIKPGACIIDIGITRKEGKLYGDVDFDNVKDKAGYITPVPGGVGVVTVACLMLNTIKALCLQKKIKISELS